MNCRTITIFGARYALQRLRPFRDCSLGVSPQIQGGWRTAAFASISDLTSDIATCPSEKCRYAHCRFSMR
jgi:hypothetical protein